MFNVHYTWTISKVSIILIWLVLNIQSVKLKASLTIIPKTRSNPGRLFLQGEISFLRYWTHSVTHSRLTRLPAPCIFWYISLIKSSILKLKNIFIQLAINDSFGDHPVKQQTKPRGYLYVFIYDLLYVLSTTATSSSCCDTDCQMTVTSVSVFLLFNTEYYSST